MNIRRLITNGMTMESQPLRSFAKAGDTDVISFTNPRNDSVWVILHINSRDATEYVSYGPAGHRYAVGEPKHFITRHKGNRVYVLENIPPMYGYTGSIYKVAGNIVEIWLVKLEEQSP